MTTRPDRLPRGRRVHLGVFYAGVNPLDWSDTTGPTQIDPAMLRRVAQTAEHGLFDMFFFGEGLRLREHLGRVVDINVAGRPDAIAGLAAVAAVTDRIGLVATQNATYHHPVDVANRLAALAALSDGRAGWNVVTTHNAWTGANFRRGGFLDGADRYRHAEAALEVAEAVWDAWTDPAGAPGEARVSNDFFSVRTTPRLPVPPESRPLIVQAGESSGGRELGARRADVIFSRHAEPEPAIAFADDIRRRARRAGRESDPLILAGVDVIVAATPADAVEKEQAWLARVWDDRHVIEHLEKVWGHPLDDHDPDGPLPAGDPVIDDVGVTGGNPDDRDGPLTTATRWRRLADERGYSTRELVRAVTDRRRFRGSADEVADQLVEAVARGAFDGVNMGLTALPGGLDDAVDLLVPALQARGAYPDAYADGGLRRHLGIDEREDAA